MQIHVARDGKELGVFSLEEVNRQLAAGTLRLNDQAWYEGAAGWVTLSTVPGVSAALANVTPQVSPTAAAATPAVVVPQRKSETLAVLSLIFSILGLCGFCCGFFVTAAIAGIVCGHIALSRIKANPGAGGSRSGHGRSHHWLRRRCWLAHVDPAFWRPRRVAGNQ